MHDFGVVLLKELGRFDDRPMVMSCQHHGIRTLGKEALDRSIVHIICFLFRLDDFVGWFLSKIGTTNQLDGIIP